MLVDFTVSNFGPFRDQVTLSMKTTGLKDDPPNIHHSEGSRMDLLTSVVVFGANASGKSYLIDAVQILQDVIGSVRTDSDHIPGYMPFRLSRETIDSPVNMRIRLMVDNILYDYGISFDSNKITDEYLTYYPNGYPVKVFHRGDGSVDEKIFSNTTSTTSYLWMASGFNNTACNITLKAIRGIHVVRGPASLLATKSFGMAQDDPSIKDGMLSALYSADFGITGFSGDLNKTRSNKDDEWPIQDVIDQRNIWLHHDFPSADADPHVLDFPLFIESDGTVDIFGMMGPILSALRDGQTIMIDEFGSHLHPMLTRWIVGLFSTKINDMGAQLVVNTHDLTLMDPELLRRDQIWFTNKNRLDGSSELYSLSDFKNVRKNSDFQKAYLYGRFDAVPMIIGRRSD